MALGIKSSKESIEVISYADEAVTCDRDRYSEYLQTLDESLLQLAEGIEPTRFCLRTKMKYEHAEAIKNKQLEVSGRDVIFKLGFMLDYVRYVLYDIKNPGEGLAFKRDSDGFCHKDIIDALDQAGVVLELYSAREGFLNSKNQKKS